MKKYLCLCLFFSLFSISLSAPTVASVISDINVEFESDEFSFEIPADTFGNVQGPLWITIDTTGFPSWLKRDVYDVGNITQVGQLDGTFGDIHLNGDYIYAASTPNLKIIDLSDPVNPELTASNLYINSQFRKIFTFNGGRSALATVWSNTNCNACLRVLNVTDKDDPVSLYSLSTSRSLQGIHIEGDYAYTVSASPSADMEVWDLSDVEDVKRIGWFAGLGMGLDVSVKDGRCYIADGAGSGDTTGMFVLNVTDKSAYYGRGHVETFYQGKKVMAVERNPDFVFLANGQYTYLYDCTDPTTPDYYSGYASPGFNAGDYAESNGILMSTHDEYNSAGGSVMVSDLYYWSQFDEEGDTVIPDPYIMGFVDDSRFYFENVEFRGIAVYKNYVYVTDMKTGAQQLRVLDINMRNPSISVRGGHVALATGETTVTITATDSTGSVSTSFKVSVECTNDLYGPYCNETEPIVDDDNDNNDNNDNDNNDNDDDGINVGRIVAAVVIPTVSVAVICILLLVVLVCCCICCCIRKKNKGDEMEVEMTNE